MSFARFIPLLIRLFPQLLRPTFYRGSLVVMNNVHPATDAQIEAEIDRKIKRRSERPNDSSRVVKVSDALKCVEEKFNTTTLIKEFVLVAAKSLISGTQSEACGQRLFDRIEDCIIEKALSQKSERIKEAPKTKYHRPARGHGKGRRGF